MASSFPQFHSDRICPTNLVDYQSPVSEGNGGVTLWGDVYGCPLYANGDVDNYMHELDAIMSPSVCTGLNPEMLGVSDMEVPILSECNLSQCGVAQVFHDFGPEFQADFCDLQDDCTRFVPDYKPVFPSADTWGTQSNQIPSPEEPPMKVGRYSVEERKDRILRYLKKRNQRNFNKTIKYACRKTLADRRVRVRGRFARNNELCNEEMVMNKNKDPCQEKEVCYADAIQIKNDDEDWLQEAMASSLYLPYISG
ncbi:CCT domain [Dillenia turbinata]|uniref:CCT domain n=1 Tax=Dillenia turbinata TaxID=194707 RepID=A0AAN8W6W0_9MAGN